MLPFSLRLRCCHAGLAPRTTPPPDASCACVFLPPLPQLGALAEFRADWAAALRMYGEAYGYLPQVG